MHRREFIGTGTLGAVGLLAAKLPAINTMPNKQRLSEETVASLRKKMESGEMTAESITKAYLDNIAELDKAVNSIIEVNPDALNIARALDKERKNGKVRGPLHGIPVVIKDNIDTADKMLTTAGSLALVHAPKPSKDAAIVKQLRDAGAIILAKTNLSEWANFRSSNSSSGWSGRGGQTHNPYVLNRNPCGSSSGTGAAISSNFATIGIGTETDGSIICPSSVCGIVGIKPTLGLVSRSGIIPIAHSQDTAGPMARTVADAAELLNVLDAVDASDTATTANGKREKVDYTNFLKADGLKGARIGVARDYWGTNKAVDTITDPLLEKMRAAGAELIDVKFPSLKGLGSAENLILQYEFKTDLEKYLRARNAEHKTLKDLIQFNEDNRSREMPYFEQEIFEESAKRGSLTTVEYQQALKKAKLASQTNGIDAVVAKNNLDAIFAPSNGPVWLTDHLIGDCGGSYVSSSQLAAVAGYPSITVPAGFIGEMPIGVSFFGKAFTEGALIKIAYAFEQMTKARREPKFLPNDG